MNRFLELIWYKKHSFSCVYWFLIPFSLIYQLISSLRRLILCRFFQKPCSVPVIVIGNLTVGGVGKTPLVIAMANRFRHRGIKVGIVSRGYGAQSRLFPCEVSPDSDPVQVGDEPLLISKRTGAPVVIAPRRCSAIQFLLERHPCDVIISDDGLQHYTMARSVEIVVIDGMRQFGNAWCLPAGPLREPVTRANDADFIVVNGDNHDLFTFESKQTYSMHMMPQSLVRITDQKQYLIPLNTESAIEIAAVAGIGNPDRFFSTLKTMGLRIHEYRFPDHHLFHKDEMIFSEEMVVMTEKDAVKCAGFAEKNWYFLPVDAQLSDDFWHALYSHPSLKRLFDS